MDLNGENSSDSIEIELLTDIQPLAEGIPTQITVSDPSAILNGTAATENHGASPKVVIVEQPQQRGFRFRYECEGPSHGGLQGVNSERGRKTYPSIRIEGYDGPARIQVSLVTEDNPPRMHAHKLVGKNCTNGICDFTTNSTATDINFSNLCVQHVTKKKAAEVLTNRMLEDLKLQKNMTMGTVGPETFTAEENASVKKQAKSQAQNMPLNVVRLQFKVLLMNNDKRITGMLPLVVSQSIYDSKSPGASALKICRMDKYGGCCTGNEEVFLLCEKVQKEDIAVRFVEHNPDGSVKWEAYGNFSPLDVHRQYAIVFKTPAYYNANIDKAVNVMIMLQRKSDADVSEAKAFTYYPQNKDIDLIARKKRKKLPLDTSFNYYGGDGGPPGGGGHDGGMGGGYGGPQGPGGFGGGGGTNGGDGGGGGGFGNYSVIMSNGNVVDHLSVLPTTVEQVVKEEFARSHTERPDSTSTDDTSPLASPYDPMLWNGDLTDLEIDAAPSLPRPSQTLITTARPLSSKPSDIPEDSSADILSSSRDNLDVSEKSTHIPENSTENRTLMFEKCVPEIHTSKQKDMSAKKNLKNKRKENSESTRKNNTSTNAESANTFPSPKVTVDIHTTASIPSKPKPEKITLPTEEERRKGDQSDGTQSPTKFSELTVSSVKTDEGFSEVSGEVSGKEEEKILDPSAPNISPTAKGRQARVNVKESKEVSSEQMKTTTVVVKRVMERITMKTVQALQDFAETGDIRYLLLVQRHLTAFKNENGDLPIHLAVINNQTTSLRQLLDVMTSLPNASRSINAFNYMRQTALHLAAIMHQPEHLELLLLAGANPGLADRHGNTPAHLAVINDSLHALSALLKYLQPGATATEPFPELNHLNYDGYSPVHLAVLRGSVDMLRVLVRGKAKVNLPDGKSGRTALHHAVELDDLPVAGFLLMEACADVNARCFDGNTPLHIACCRGLMGMVALLMTAGASVSIENEEIPLDEGMEQGEQAEQEGTSPTCRRGLLPSDYVSGKDREQIMSMLMGGQCAVDQEDTGNQEECHQSMESEGDVDNDLEADMDVMMTCKSSCDSGLAVSLTSHSVSSLAVDHKLSDKVQQELCRILDPVETGRDVYSLAGRLGYDNIISALEVMGCSGSSPTSFLLSYHETYGTLDKLRECLMAMQRKDAVQLIDSLFGGGRQTKHCCHTSDPSSLKDSGVLSFTS